MARWHPDFPDRTALAVCLVVAFWGLLLLAPAMWLFNRIAPGFLAASGLAGIACMVMRGEAAAVAADARRALGAPAGLAALALLGWALATLGWADMPGAGLRAYGEFVGSLLAGAVVVLIIGRLASTPLLRSDMFAVAVWTSAVAALGVLAELATGMGWRAALGYRVGDFIFNRSVLTLLLLLPPILGGLLLVRRPGAALVCGGIGLAAILLSASGAAKLALLAGALAFAVSALSLRLGRWGLYAAIVALFALAPMIGRIADATLTEPMVEALRSAHPRERMHLWMAFGELIPQAGFVGFGFNATVVLWATEIANLVSLPYREGLRWAHSHNAFMQVMIELGLVGAGLALATLLLLVAATARLGPVAQRAALTVIAMALAVMSVGHGAWQGWWWSALGAAAAWVRLCDLEERRG